MLEPHSVMWSSQSLSLVVRIQLFPKPFFLAGGIERLAKKKNKAYVKPGQVAEGVRCLMGRMGGCTQARACCPHPWSDVGRTLLPTCYMTFLWESVSVHLS